MSGKELTFKLVMEADSKSFVTNVKQSEDVTKAVIAVIKEEAEKLKATSTETAKEVGKIVPDDLQKKADQAKNKLEEVSQAAGGLEGQAVQAGNKIDSLGVELQEAATQANKAGLEISNVVPSGTSELADKLTRSLDSATGIIKGAGDNAKTTANNFNDFGNKSHTALDQLKSDLVVAKQNLESFSKTNAAPADIEKAKAQVDQLEKEVQQADQAFNNFQGEVGKANTSLKNTDTAAQTAQKGINGAKFAVTALIGAMGGIGIGLGLRELAQAADTYTNLSARIYIATKDGGDFKAAMAGVHQVALMTNTSLDATGSLFTRLNTVGKEMGMTQQNTLDLTKTINQAIQTSGGTAESSEAAITQLLQAMQGGVLRGEEFNSIMENGYGVAEALAKGLGVTTGELRKMAENGELSAERVYKALLSQKDAVQQTYNDFPLTVSNALQKIGTSWQILIGEVDQANGASATAAQWLSTLADNMMLLKPIIDDIGSGFSRFGEYYSNIYDQATIDSLKTTLVSVYETIKTLFNTVLEVGEAFHSVFSDALSNVLSFTDGLYPAGEQVSGYKKFIDLLNIALGFLSDGFKTIGIGVNLFTGTLYGLLAVWYELKATLSWGDIKKQAISDMEEMRAKSQEYFDKGFESANKFKSKMLENIDELGKTEQQKNQERIVENQKTLDQLKAQEESHKASYKVLNNERIQAEQQLYEARKSGNQAAIDLALKGLTEVDGKEKAYQAESQKITDAKIQAAQIVANAMIQSADAAGIAQLKVLNAQLAAQGLQAEFDNTGKVVVKAMDQAATGVTNLNNKLATGRKGAEALGLDLDVAFNRISEGFGGKKKNLDDFVNSLELMGIKGKQAGEVTYQAWLKWLETAKSQAEIDLAKARLKEFGDQGQISTSQVEQGLIAIKLQAQKLPDDIDPVTEAFKRLGIETKANLKLAAQQALMDYITIRDSGKATAEGVQKAYEKAAQSAAASGDAGVIAATNAANAGRNLEIQIDDTGKASVKAMDEWTKSNDRVRDSAHGIGDGYRDAGRVAREEAKSSTEAWNEAVKASSDKFKAEMKRQGESLSNGIYNYDSYSKADVLSQLKSKGYSDKEAEKLAGSIWSKAMEADRAAKEQGLGKDGSLAIKALINAEYNNAASKGLTTQHGTNKINELMRQMTASNLVSTGPSTKPVDVNSLAPNVNAPVPNTTASPTTRTVQNNISINGKTISIPVAEENQSNFNDFLSELEMLKKGM